MNLVFIVLIFQIFTVSIITAQSGIALLPPNDGSWVYTINYTNGVSAITYKGFSIKLADVSATVTPGFGDSRPGNSSYKRIQGIGFDVFSMVSNSAQKSINIDNHNATKDYLFYSKYTNYCYTLEIVTTQCDSPLKGLPLSNEENQEWKLMVTNPFNNSQKVYVSFISDKNSTNATNIDTDNITSGTAKYINNERQLLILAILFPLIWKYLLTICI
ncbi:hypothetical protein C2G38_2136839 [Gigaspora rosea]|uniref:Uncharacterized protein n=1 Tax=Gigaspora rosea TaxID=44941 RepID=A0A397W3X6_9GLOM|nr:hypothetical protein C2G38_2136839 [Gigaspora rosea]